MQIHVIYIGLLKEQSCCTDAQIKRSTCQKYNMYDGKLTFPNNI